MVVAKSQFPVTRGFRFPSILQHIRSISWWTTGPNQTFRENYRKVFPLRWRINHFALNLFSWDCLTIIQINESHIFVPLTLDAKLTVTKALVHLRLNLTYHSPTKHQVVGIVYHCNFHWNLICLHVLSKNYMMPFVCKCRVSLVWEPFVEVWGVAQRRRCLRGILSLHTEMVVSPNATKEAA